MHYDALVDLEDDLVRLVGALAPWVENLLVGWACRSEDWAVEYLAQNP